MRIFHPKPEPAPDPVIYAVDGLLSRETWKAVDIITACRLPSSPLLYQGDPGSAPAWIDWVESEFGTWVAPYLIQAREVAVQGVLELAERDKEFAPQLSSERRESSARYGLTLLEQSLGARHMSQVSKFHRLVTDGTCPGHAVTVLALRSVLFGTTALNTLVAALFCEWTGALGQHPAASDREGLQDAFAGATPLPSRQISSWLHPASNNTFQSGTQS